MERNMETLAESSEANQPNQDQVQDQQDELNVPMLELKSSVLQAIVEIEFCDIPLRQTIIDALASEPDFKPPSTFKEFIKFDSRPVLHTIELNKLEEIKNACLLLRNPYKHIVNKTEELGDAIKLTEAAIRRLIKMSKRLQSFSSFSQNDQVALLKGSIIEMMCIRATKNCNYQNDYWYFIDDKKGGVTIVSMGILKHANWINLMAHKTFAARFNSQFPDDMLIVDLLTVIILFRPSRANVANKESVRDEFLNYCYLLKRYLSVKLRDEPCKAKTVFITLMHRLEELYYLSEDIVRLYLDMNPENAGPLFIELFDLK